MRKQSPVLTVGAFIFRVSWLGDLKQFGNLLLREPCPTARFLDAQALIGQGCRLAEKQWS